MVDFSDARVCADVCRRPDVVDITFFSVIVNNRYAHGGGDGYASPSFDYRSMTATRATTTCKYVTAEIDCAREWRVIGRVVSVIWASYVFCWSSLIRSCFSVLHVCAWKLTIPTVFDIIIIVCRPSLLWDRVLGACSALADCINLHTIAYLDNANNRTPVTVIFCNLFARYMRYGRIDVCRSEMVVYFLYLLSIGSVLSLRCWENGACELTNAVSCNRFFCWAVLSLSFVLKIYFMTVERCRWIHSVLINWRTTFKLIHPDICDSLCETVEVGDVGLALDTLRSSLKSWGRIYAVWQGPTQQT